MNVQATFQIEIKNQWLDYCREPFIASTHKERDACVQKAKRITLS